MSSKNPDLPEAQDEFSQELAKRLLTACRDSIGAGFHPDTLGSQYVDASFARTMDDVTARTFDLTMAYVFAVLDDSEIYKPPPTYASFVYGTSRSGATEYHTVVLLRPDLESVRGDDWAMAQSFLFWPSDAHPLGEVNAPSSFYKGRLKDVSWALTDIKNRTSRDEHERFKLLIASGQWPAQSERASR